MRVLIVARCKKGRYAPFITEQVAALQKLGVQCQFFGIQRNGLWGYLRQWPEFLRAIRSFRPDVIHAHYGLSGLFATLQKRVPVVTTFHGSDINNPKVRKLSNLAIRRSRFSIFVSRNNLETAGLERDYALIPCGIDLEDYPRVDKADARRRMGLDADGKYVLFAGAFDNPVKNAPLAKAAVHLLPDVELLELKGYTREQVALLMQAVDAFLMTSFMEGSPQVIKEAMACGCPIVSVDVGDVKERTGALEGCYVAQTREPAALADLLKRALSFSGRTRGREALLAAGLSNDVVAGKLMDIYRQVIIPDL